VNNAKRGFSPPVKLAAGKKSQIEELDVTV
jgi:hypothetical protein